MNPYTKSAVNAGKKTLRDMLPEAFERAARHPSNRVKAYSESGRQLVQAMRVDNVKSIVIYQVPGGGWIADLMLKVGFGENGENDVIGAPRAYPLPTFAAAKEYALVLLTVMINDDE